ncbi:MAG: molybdenum cofactor biosynthesis protein MoaE [Opitutales bacterium]
MSFRLQSTAIEPEVERRAFAAGPVGAFVTFEGWVRDTHQGRAVLALDYEAFEPLAVKEGEAILAELRRDHAIADVRVVHRLGHLRLGACAVWVGITAPHRQAAFDAVAVLMDQLKARVPIWKKEHYADGTSGWVRMTE